MVIETFLEGRGRGGGPPLKAGTEAAKQLRQRRRWAPWHKRGGIPDLAMGSSWEGSTATANGNRETDCHNWGFGPQIGDRSVQYRSHIQANSGLSYKGSIRRVGRPPLGSEVLLATLQNSDLRDFFYSLFFYLPGVVRRDRAIPADPPPPASTMDGDHVGWVSVTVAQRDSWWLPRRHNRSLLALLLALLLLLSAGCSRQAEGTSNPARGPEALPASAPTGRLQEVAPPGGVTQINDALAGRHPQVTITSPGQGTVLPPGPWQLELAVEDWPLSNDAVVGLGPHLGVQIDGGPTLRIGDWGGADAGPGRLRLTLPELLPGSHLVTVYAARPWGEAVKRPGASAQRLVHRVSANPLSQPAPGSPQLLAVSPDGLASAEPVLIDWLLRDAPLQGLRSGDGHWRVRVSVNGDSFLVDQNTPLWLKGFRPGSNAVLLELLDGLGEPLNPPFNSVVREVTLNASAQRPIWLKTRLSERELAQVLGTAPAPSRRCQPWKSPIQVRSQATVPPRQRACLNHSPSPSPKLSPCPNPSLSLSPCLNPNPNPCLKRKS